MEQPRIVTGHLTGVIPMPLSFSHESFLAYTAWQREQWRAWFQSHGAAPLAISTGPHGDGRIPTIGALILHIFSAECRYVDRLLEGEVSDTSGVPTTNIDALFHFGDTSRKRLETYVATLPDQAWDAPIVFPLLDARFRATPRKVVLHVLTHEIRHWAQVGTLLRLNGHTGDLQDLLLSPVFGETTRL
jgi:uncharacterized damage-inducible protein DinB